MATATKRIQQLEDSRRMLDALYQDACIAKSEYARGRYEGARMAVVALGCSVTNNNGKHEVRYAVATAGR